MQVIGVPINPALGVLPAEKDVRLRDETEAETRALCLIIVATKAQEIPEQLIDTIVKQYDLAECFTPLERAFMESAAPEPEQVIGARWRYESASTMLWALGLFDTLALPDEITNVPAMVRIMTSMTPESFREASSLRPTAEILDAADLTYRFHTATHDARDNSQAPPGKVIESVVYERGYALNWLIRYPDEAWDDLGNEAESAD